MFLLDLCIAAHSVHGKSHPVSPRTEWVFTVWKDRYGASLFYLLRTVIIYELCYFILKNSSQNKEMARENFCKETRN